MIARTAVALALALLASPLAAADPTSFAGAADVAAQLSAMAKAMAPGQGFAYQPLVRDGATAAGLEIWKKPGRPAVHPAEGEYVVVIDGAGTLISGGTLVGPIDSRPGLTEGSRIDGGTTRRLAKGDVFLIPAGTPHWFGITGARLVMLGIKLPTGPSTADR